MTQPRYYAPVAAQRDDRYRLSVNQFSAYQRLGFLVVRGLVAGGQVDALRAHAMDLLEGRVVVDGVAPPAPGATLAERQQRTTRIHMLHRVDATSEAYLLQPRVLDVLEALTGPDVLALQTMLFFNAPGTGGQGWHQDAYYITTYPETLIGAWLALDRADEGNGCLWVAPGSHCEPIYPDDGRGALVHARGAFADATVVTGISHLDDGVNTLSRQAARYRHEPVVVAPGDVVFFHSRLLHRSHPNASPDRWRRAFVCHYCNARSWVPWNHGAPWEGEAANHLHILARGDTHLAYAQPRFGTPCAGARRRRGPAPGRRPRRRHGAGVGGRAGRRGRMR